MNQLIRQLEQVRSRVRALLVARETCSLLTHVLTWTAVIMLADYMLLLPSPLRMIILVVGITLLVFRFRNSVIPAISFRPSITKMALRAERYKVRLRERLASAVEFSISGADRDNQLAAASVRDVYSSTEPGDLSGMVNSRPAIKAALLAMMLALIASLFLLAYPSLASTGIQRIFVPFGSAAWPATTGIRPLLVDGSIHPRGVPIALAVELIEGDPGSTRVSAEYSTRDPDGTTRTQSTMLARQAGSRFERIIIPEGDEITVSFSTFDFETDPIGIRIVQPPEITSSSLVVTPPVYASRVMDPIELDLGGGTDARANPEASFLEGSRAVIDLRTNKPIPVPEVDLEGWVETTFGEIGENARFTVIAPDQFRLERDLERSMGSVVSIVDEHGIGNIEEIAFGFQVIPDRDPAATIIQPSMDDTVLADAVVPVVAEVRDDIAVERSSIDVSRSNGDEVLRNVPGGGGSDSVRIEHDLDLSEIGVVTGDVIEIVARGSDGFESNGSFHAEARSLPRRLVVISETEFIDVMREQLASVRRNAMRLDGMQSDSQERIRNGGFNTSGDQSRIGERIANTTEAVREMRDRIERNRLDDPMLSEMLLQSEDILREAARSSAEAGDLIDLLEEGIRSSREPTRSETGGPGNTGAVQRNEPTPRGGEGDSSASPPESVQGPPGAPGDSDGARDPSGDTDESNETEPLSDRIIERQQEVRDELGDLISLLDRDEDAWVVTREVESMLEEAVDLLEETREAGGRTVGRARDELNESERSDIDRIAERQRDAARRSEELADDLRDRSRVLEETDQQRSESLESAARRAERSDLSRTMESAAAQIRENRMANAQQAQQAVVDTLERMLEDLNEDEGARAEQLIRQLAGLIDSIERLIMVNEDELIRLDRIDPRGGDVDTEEITLRSRSLITLVRNTESVADQARSAGPGVQRITRGIDRAADAQGTAVAALREDEPDLERTRVHLESSLRELNSALQRARDAEQRAREDESRRQREEIAERYRNITEREVSIRVETEQIADVEDFTRRELVKARKLAIQQESVRIDLRNILEDNPDLDDSPLITRMHEIIDSWSVEVARSLQEGEVDGLTLDRQEMIIEGLLNMIDALDQESGDEENPFDQNQQNGEQQGSSGPQSGQENPIVPPLAELKLLRNMQQMVYSRTRRLSEVIESGFDDQSRIRSTLEEISSMQGDLHRLGTELLESIQESGSGTDVGAPEQSGGSLDKESSP